MSSPPSVVVRHDLSVLKPDAHVLKVAHNSINCFASPLLQENARAKRE